MNIDKEADMAETQQTANLHAKDGAVTQVQVPSFPDNPALVLHEGRYYTGAQIEYGGSDLDYSEVDAPYEV